MKAFNYNWTNAMEGGRLIDPSRPWEYYSETAVWNDVNGDVTLHALTLPKTIKHWDGKTYHPDYAVGVMRSSDTFGYGTFSADIKLPKGRNLWPSFWLVGEGHWPDNGEIDIMEAWSNSNGSYYRFPLGWRTTTNVHYLDGEHKKKGSKNISLLKQPKNPTEHFIRYEAEWRPNKVTFKANGKTVREVGWDVTRHFLNVQMHVIFNLWTDSEDFTCETPMVVRNFKFEAL